MTRKHSIYVYQCPITFEYFYVGQDSKSGARGNKWHPPHSGPRLNNKLAKLERYGLKPIIHRLLEFDTCEHAKKILDDAEIYWIAEGYSRGWQLLNGTLGGDGWQLGQKHSEETKKKMSLIKKGKKFSESHRKNIGFSSRGRKFSDEAREKIRQAMLGNSHTKGMKLSEEHRRKISARLIGNKYSVGHVCSDAHKRKLSEALKGRISHRKGKKLPLQHTQNIALGNKKRKEVICLNDGLEFTSYRAAGKRYNVSHQVVRKCCKSGREIKGLRFKTKDTMSVG